MPCAVGIGSQDIGGVEADCIGVPVLTHPEVVLAPVVVFSRGLALVLAALVLVVCKVVLQPGECSD